MTQSLSIERTANDLVDATLIALTDSGILARTTRQSRVLVIVWLLILGAVGAALGPAKN